MGLTLGLTLGPKLGPMLGPMLGLTLGLTLGETADTGDWARRLRLFAPRLAANRGVGQGY